MHLPTRHHRRTTPRARFALLGLSLVALSLVFSFRPAFAASYNATGIVYRDYNANGLQDAREPGYPGVYVRAVTGTAASPTYYPSVTGVASGSDGSYSITVTNGLAARIEFGTLVSGTFTPGVLPSGFKPSAHTASSGLLTGRFSGTTENESMRVNMTNEGTSEWVHWGRTAASGTPSIDRKSGVAVADSITTSNKASGSGTVTQEATSSTAKFSWSGGITTGTPAGSATGADDPGYIYLNGTNETFSFTAPADLTMRTLRVYVSYDLTSGTDVVLSPSITAHLSDSSAADYTNNGVRVSNTTANNDFDVLPTITGMYVFNYRAKSASQTLTITLNTGTFAGLKLSLRAATIQKVGKAAATSTDSTTVAFITDTTTAGQQVANLGINRPVDYCQQNPTVAVGCMRTGNSSTFTNVAAINTFSYTNTGAPQNNADSQPYSGAPTALVNISQVGPTFGLAYRSTNGYYYASALMRRHASFGPGGIDAVYVIDPTQPIASRVVNTVHLGSGVGTDPRAGETFGATYFFHDGSTNTKAQGIFDAVGKVGIGDIQLSEDGLTLYAVSLGDKSLYPISLASATPSVGSAIAIPTPTCSRGTSRPYGLGQNAGLIYVGVVCSAENNNGRTSDLAAYVYVYTPGTGFNTTPVLTISNFTYAHGQTQGGGSSSTTWNKWATDWPTTFGTNTNVGFTQPILSDIAFDNGDMIVAFRDRFGDQTGLYQGNTTTTDATTFEANTSGAIYRATLSGATWTLEANATLATGLSTSGVGNNQGPGSGQFYYSDGANDHFDALQGSVLQLPGFPEVMSTGYDLNRNYYSGGIRRLDNYSGTGRGAQNNYQMYAGSDANAAGKANGFGGLVAICNAAPIEVGNRLWYDTTANGIQDPGELPIVGVTVNLYDSAGNKIATAKTDANGSYFFTNDTTATVRGAGTGTTSTANYTYLSTLNPSTTYYIRIDNPADYNDKSANGPIGALYDTGTSNWYTATTAYTNGGSSPNSDTGVTDNKATTGKGPGAVTSNYPQISFTTGTAGTDNHALDFGFTLGSNPLAARVSYVKVSQPDGSRNVTVEWAATHETNALGYDLYAGSTRLNSHIIPAHNVVGKSNAVYSASVSLPAGVTGVSVVDVEPGGKTKQHGPYAVGTTTGAKPDFSRATAPTTNRDPSDISAPIKLAKTDAALSIAQDGIYHLSYEQLTQQGIDLAGVAPTKLALSHNDKTVGIYVKTAKRGKFAAGDYIEFAATAQDDFYNGASVYVLSARPSGNTRHLAQPPSVSLAQKPGDPAAKTVARTLPGRAFYWDYAPAESSAWTWALLENDIPELADQSATFDLPNLYNSGSFGSQTVTVTLNLRGWGGYADVAPDHHAVVDVAGVHGEATFDQDETATIRLNVPASALAATGNSLRLRTPGDKGVEYDTIVLESISVSYPQATALPAAFTKVANVRAATRATDLTKDITAQAGGKSADYLVIAHSDFVAGVAPLAALHRSEGLRVAVVDANALYDVYGDGTVSAETIQKAIAALSKQRGLKYVLLVGADNWDARDYRKEGNRSFIPAYHAPDSTGIHAPSDTAYSDVNGDGLPDVALGRLPVRDSAELAAYIGKIGSFSAATTTVPAATFVTDPTDPHFAAISANVAAILPKAAQVANVTWQEGNADAARAQLVSKWQSGQRIINYVGHSNGDVWADDVVLDSSSLAAIGQGKPALVTVWGCLAATFDKPGAAQLTTALLTLQNGGAAAVVASTTDVSASQYSPTSQQFYAALYASAGARIGDAFLNTQRSIFGAHRDWTDLAHGLTLLGDPAARA